MQLISNGYLANCSQYADIFGTTGNPINVDYHIHEFTDATHLTLVQSETGTCPLTFLAGNTSLNRAAANAVLWHTWVTNTDTYLPSANFPSTLPTPLNIGNNPLNILISMGPFAGGTYSVPRFINQTNFGTGSGTIADCSGVDSFHAESVNGDTFAYPSSLASIPANYANNTIIYTCYYVMRTKYYQTASIYNVSTPVSGALARIAIYDVDNKGWLGNLRCDWNVNGGSDFDLSSTGLKSSTLNNPIYLTTGWYGIAYMSNLGVGTNGPMLAARTNTLLNPFGTGNGVIIQAATIVKPTYSTFPNPADPYSTTIISLSSSGTNVPVILLQ